MIDPRKNVLTERAKRMLAENIIGILTDGASKPDRIGRRCIVLAHVLEMHGGVACKSKVLARRLKVSEARICRAIAITRAMLDELIS